MSQRGCVVAGTGCVVLHEEGEKDKATMEFLMLIVASVWNDQGSCPMYEKSCLLLAD